MLAYIDIPHAKMRSIMKLFPLLIQIFGAIESQSEQLKIGLLKILMVTFVISRITDRNFKAEDIFSPDRMEGDCLYPKDKFRSLLFSSGFLQPSNLVQFNEHAYNYMDILNLPIEKVTPFTGEDLINKLFYEDAFTFLGNFFHRKICPENLFYSALLFNRETFK